MRAERTQAVVEARWRRRLGRAMTGDFDSATVGKTDRTPEERALARDRVVFWTSRGTRSR
jgi:hypothetical protein